MMIAISACRARLARTAVTQIERRLLGTVDTVGKEDIEDGLKARPHYDERGCDDGDVVFNNDDYVRWDDDPCKVFFMRGRL